MVNTPVVAELPDGEPEIDPNMALATTAAFAGPPRDQPVSPSAMSMNHLLAPAPSISAPKMRKTITMFAAMPSGNPKMPASLT